MIPDISRHEWEDMISEKINPKLTSLSFQLKLNSLKLDVRLHRTDNKAAVIELHKFCSSNERMYQKDLNTIFKLA